MTRSLSYFWDCYARCYDGLLQSIPYQRLIAQTLGRIPPQGAHSILDAGCGTGNLLGAVHQAHPKFALTGIDFSAAMLARARRKLPGAALQTGDLNLPLPFSDCFQPICPSATHGLRSRSRLGGGLGAHGTALNAAAGVTPV